MSLSTSISRLLLRRHELPVGFSALPYTKCADTLWSYVTTDIFGGTFDSVRHSSNYADPIASDPASSAGSTTSTASIRFPSAPNDFATSNESHPQHPPCSDSFHISYTTPSYQSDPCPAWSPPTLIPQSYWPPHPHAVDCNSHRTFSTHPHTFTPTNSPPPLLHPSQLHQQPLQGSPKHLH